tara:strand:- start:219 stop:419 length:201 start_codon:yes stop_codon:yes gene_type:complete
MMKYATREEKIEKILQYWEEGWYSGKLQDAFDELKGLHTGQEFPLTQWNDEEIGWEYEEAERFFNE